MEKRYNTLISKLAIITLFAFIFGILFNTTALSAVAKASSSNVLSFYNKVQFNKTKKQIDAILGTPKKQISNGVECYIYMDKSGKSGVNVIYSNKGDVVSKTAVYQLFQDIACFNKKPVSQKQSKKIKAGFKYSRVKAILGGDGVEVSSTHMGAKGINMYRWANKDGSFLQVIVMDDGTVANVYYYSPKQKAK